jgi:hypothetical protein
MSSIALISTSLFFTLHFPAAASFVPAALALLTSRWIPARFVSEPAAGTELS